MAWGIRSCALAVGAAALLSAQAAYAAPTRSSGVDPLVSLSVLGSTQSRAAVCGGATFGAASCATPMAAVAATAATSAAAAQGNGGGKAIGPWAAVLGLAVIIAIVAAITSGGNNNSSGDLTPISPA